MFTPARIPECSIIDSHMATSQPMQSCQYIRPSCAGPNISLELVTSFGVIPNSYFEPTSITFISTYTFEPKYLVPRRIQSFFCDLVCLSVCQIQFYERIWQSIGRCFTHSFTCLTRTLRLSQSKRNPTVTSPFLSHQQNRHQVQLPATSCNVYQMGVSMSSLF